MTDTTATTIAVASGKGGVGKSTVAALLALAYAEEGMEVALLDADLYGPSLPTLFHLEGQRHEVSEDQKIIPIRYGKLQLVSFGFILGQLPAVMRGPMIARYTAQLLNDVLWEPHQVLIIDLPPGTGDIHLTTTQSRQIDSAVIVTTPHALSFSDVGKAILMLNKVKVPIAGFVLNMAYFLCTHCQTEHRIFGTAALETIAIRFGIPALASLPLDADRYGRRMSDDDDTVGSTAATAAPSDTPTGAAADAPAAVAPSTAAADALAAANPAQRTRAVDPEIQRLAAQLWQTVHAQSRPEITVSNDYEAIEITVTDGGRYRINPYRLRCACRCALCYDEYRGLPLRMDGVPETVFAEQIKLVGNYALYIKWSDGHDTGFFPLDYVYSLCGQPQTATKEQQQ